jgi:dTDP-4-amino-4,6-dideoxygalactose transaminase
MLRYDETEKCNFHYIVVEVEEAKTGVSRDLLLGVLHAENVLARRYFYPGCHRMEPYRSYFPHAGLLLPETERVASRVLLLPNGEAVGIEEISTICQIVRLTVRHGPELTERLKDRS